MKTKKKKHWTSDPFKYKSGKKLERKIKEALAKYRALSTPIKV